MDPPAGVDVVTSLLTIPWNWTDRPSRPWRVPDLCHAAWPSPHRTHEILRATESQLDSHDAELSEESTWCGGSAARLRPGTKQHRVVTGSRARPWPVWWHAPGTATAR